MKQNLSYSQQKRIICEIIALSGLENQSNERKAEIINYLPLVVPREKDAGFAAIKDRLADWILNHYYELKSSGHIFLQYGNLKFLATQTKDWMLNLFKKIDQKIGDSLDYNELYRAWLMKNPYFLYQQMGYMTPPYMMPPSYPTNRQSYDSYSMDPQQHYMQMSKCYPMNHMNPMNPMYMPPMPSMSGMGMPKYQPQTPQMKSHPFYTYPMIPPPPPQNTSYPPGQSQKLKVSTQQNNSKNKNSDNKMQGEQNLEINKKKNKEKHVKEKNQPFFIIQPFMQKVVREQIPERLVPIANISAVEAEINHDSSEIQIVDQIGGVSGQAKTGQKSRKIHINSNMSCHSNAQAIANIMKSFEQEKNRKMAQVAQKNIIPMGQQCRVELQNCVCKGYALIEDFYECIQCHRKFHYACTEKKEISTPQQRKQVCHFCFMRNLDPLNRVIADIKTPYVVDIKRNKIVEVIDFQAYDSYINKSSPYEIQIRCMRLEHASNMIPEYTWPDECLVMLDDERTIQFQALQHNSSLKKRKDMSVFLTNYIYFYNKNLAKRKHLTVGLEIKQNTPLELSQKKMRNNHIFVFGVYLIKKITPDELSDQILNDTTNKVNFVQKFFSEPADQQQVEIQQIKVNLMDPYSWNLIDIPVRGRKCIHGQCFDLKTFLSFMNVSKFRQWKCPVCNKQCRSFFVDMQQMQVIKEFKRKESDGGNQRFSKQIQFHRDGRTLFVVQKESDDEEQKNNNSSDCNKTKIIAKST